MPRFDDLLQGYNKERILADLAKPEMTMAEIGRVYGCTRAYIQQMYEQAGRPYQGLSGRERSKKIFRNRIIHWKPEMFDLPTSVRIAIALATDKGYTANPVIYQRKYGRGYVQKNTVIINGVMCRVSYVTTWRTYTPSEYRYAQVFITKSLAANYDVQISVLLTPAGEYVVYVTPMSDIIRAYERFIYNPQYVLYFLLGERKQERKAEIDMTKYLGAWHYLPKKSKKEALMAENDPKEKKEPAEVRILTDENRELKKTARSRKKALGDKTVRKRKRSEKFNRKRGGQ